MVINIVTPCTRLSNLKAIAESIPVDKRIRWWVIFEYNSIKDIPDLELSTWQKMWAIEFVKGSDYGHTQRNYVIDSVVNEGEFIYSLDDDNILHPNFLSIMEQVDSSCVFQQDVKGRIRDCNRIEVNHIDNAQFCVRKSDIGDIRYGSEYEADGLFIQQLKDKLVKVHRIGSYYNKLR